MPQWRQLPVTSAASVLKLSCHKPNQQEGCKTRLSSNWAFCYRNKINVTRGIINRLLYFFFLLFKRSVLKPKMWLSLENEEDMCFKDKGKASTIVPSVYLPSSGFLILFC